MIEITETTYRNAMIVVAVVAFAMLPFWPYSSWGYLPTMLAVGVVVMMAAARMLARD
jgi:cytosine/uracil/thiamine/allantoin permease